MKVFSITDIPEFSKKERIVVVGIIGKSPYRYPNKTTPLLPSVQSEENGIECHWDERHSVLYLHAVTHLDTKQLTALAANLDEDSSSTDKDADAANWLVASGELAMEASRLMALLFNLCHIVVLSSPTPVFDMGYLQLFKAIDVFRTELAPRAAAALSGAGAGGAWLAHGRCCCPRLLFHFRRAPAPLRSAPAALKRLEHAVEDQLYFILRKARIITNVCAKTLFAIPKNEEFVYISSEEESGTARDVSSLVRGLVQLCGAGQPAPPPARTFRGFLRGHVDQAFGPGFDDNVGKYAMSTSFFELPSASAWRVAAQALAPLHAGGSAAAALHDALATDVRFSQARCAKVLPIAQASYTEGLPAHYSSQHHTHKVKVALGVLDTMARGPLAGGARARLRTACAALWRARSLCEAPSLTGHACIEPEHDSSKEHSSGVRYVSACNCGRTKCARDDPYTVRRANCGFYTHAAAECGVCTTLQAIDFPVFQPSTPTYRAASVKGGSSQEAADAPPGGELGGSGEGGESGGTGAPGDDADGWSAPDALSPGSANDDDDDDDKSPADSYVVPVRDSGTEKVMSRQPSTTEYLPGMLHTASPAGLLPAFPSWSLVCLGASSLYSHSLGLPEHLQPGFLPHTNYLLPWDCAVRYVTTIYFPSWSLVCLGASSLYSHSLGLPEHLQPGFLPHTNYLLPWDCAVRYVTTIYFPSWSLVCLGASSLYSHSLGLPEHLQPGFLPHTNYLLPWDCAVRYVTTIYFPSWSLVCLGASSLYSHSLGLPEHLQPGFLPHTNYLLPWDCAVRMEAVSVWRASGAGAGAGAGVRGRGKAPPHHLTVKIFIGLEYECPRGHRFMMSGPDTVVNGGGGGGAGREGGAGARLAATDMPLYAACLCRAAPHAAPAPPAPPAPPAAMLAQLTRVHVVTPKAPVHVTLDPKVQPVAGGPIFVPQPTGSPAIKLSASAYWVLRLPHLYCDERGCLPRPRHPPAHPGALIAPLFGLQD